MNARSDFGLIGLAVMGQNLVLNVESRGFSVSVYNRTGAVTDDFVARHPGKHISGHATLEAFVASLARPRKVMLMVKAGAAVDAVIEQLIPLLEADDIVIDGGNSLYTDTERRDAWLRDKGLRFIGAGVSGGEEGARKGPSIMPGGPASTWQVMRPIFEAIAAKVDGQPCVIHIGPGGAGHYVKMIHNGIEYGDMQLICEAYALFKAAGFTTDEMAAIFEQWNEGELQSYLIQITAKALAQKDPQTGQPVVDLILDKAGQKGTGQWTLLNAAENAVVDQHHQRRGRGARAVVAEGAAGRGEQGAERATGWRRGARRAQGDAGRQGARRALRLQGRQLRAGARPDAHDGREARLGPRPRRDRVDLARRLHHPRALPQPHHRGLPRRPGAAQPDAGAVLRAAAQPHAAALARGRRAGRHERHPGAGVLGLARLLRQPAHASGCRPTCCRRSATSSAPTPTSASTGRRASSSTPSGPKWSNETVRTPAAA